jgi:hypothetical protein
MTSLQDRIEANPDAFYDSDTSLSDYQFEDDILDDPLDMTLEGISSRNRKRGDQLKFTQSGRNVRQAGLGGSGTKHKASVHFEPRRSSLKVKDTAIK